MIISAGGLAPENEHRATLLSYDCTVESMRAVLRVLFHDSRFAEDEEYVQRRYEMSVVPGAWEMRRRGAVEVAGRAQAQRFRSA